MSEKSVGRPSKYREEFCDLLISHMARGLSFESFAAVIKVNQDTLHEWVKVHPNFSEAKKVAFSENLLFWEQQGIDGLYSTVDYDEETGKPLRSKTLNSPIWIFNMKNRHKWRDRQPDETDVVVNNINGLSDEDLDAKIDEKIKRLSEK